MAKYCSNCGEKIGETNSFCPGCGQKIKKEEVKEEKQNNVTVTKTNSKTNGLSIAGFVISIVSLVLCCGSLSWLSLIFSIIGLTNANKNKDENKGLAIAGIIISAVALLMLIGLFALGLAEDAFNTVEVMGESL